MWESDVSTSTNILIFQAQGTSRTTGILNYIVTTQSLCTIVAKRVALLRRSWANHYGCIVAETCAKAVLIYSSSLVTTTLSTMLVLLEDLHSCVQAQTSHHTCGAHWPRAYMQEWKMPILIATNTMQNDRPRKAWIVELRYCTDPPYSNKIRYRRKETLVSTYRQCCRHVDLM